MNKRVKLQRHKTTSFLMYTKSKATQIPMKVAMLKTHLPNIQRKVQANSPDLQISAAA